LPSCAGILAASFRREQIGQRQTANGQ
jgi:hypothetical protein